MILFNLKEKLDELLNINLAYDWDNVGLLVGELDSNITSITTALELCDDVIDDAIKKKSNMILVHHPLIFSPIKKVVDIDDKQKMIIKLIKNNISLYVAHTNFDIIEGGLNDYILNLLDVCDIRPLTDDKDINTIGRIATLQTPMLLEDFALYIQEALDIKHPRIISKENKIIQNISIVTGAGFEYIQNAMEKSDVFITGDMKYHDAQDSFQKGDCIIDAGHFDTEKFFTYAMKNFLTERLEIDVHTSNSLQNPFKFVEDYYE